MSEFPLARYEGLSRLAVIGGSGFYSFSETMQAPAAETVLVNTPYANTPEAVSLEQTESGPLWFLPRHGADHSVAPHEINYRAKLWALHALGVRQIVAINAVGGISAAMKTGLLVLPEQLIDYTWGRAHTFVEGNHHFSAHIDFTSPYDGCMRDIIQQTARRLSMPLVSGGVYACTQGPRLETAAEIRRLATDGCDIVGMTGMPEAGLAREIGLRYCSVALVVNRAAGLQDKVVSLAQIRQVLEQGVDSIRLLLAAALPELQVLEPN